MSGIGGFGCVFRLLFWNRLIPAGAGTGRIYTIENVSGTVSVTEEVPPEGYVLDENNHKDIEITDAKPIVITFANEEMAELEVTKVDQDTGEALPGATLRVAYDGGHDSFDVYTNASGKAVLTGLKSGTYTITEIAAPDGYILDKTPHSVKLEPGKKATISIPNRAKPGLLIKNPDFNDEAFLERYRTVGGEIQRLKQEKIMKATASPALPDGIEEKIKSVERSEMMFDPALVGQLIEKIIVRNAKRVEVVFKSGLVENAILEEPSYEKSSLN